MRGWKGLALWEGSSSLKISLTVCLCGLYLQSCDDIGVMGVKRGSAVTSDESWGSAVLAEEQSRVKH